MRIQDDLTRPAVVHASSIPWAPSPALGVERRMLFRTGGEKAHATSLVRYAPGSRFAPHVHPGGEEFLVLDGTFQDERGDYPAGTYVRNPPHSRHAPSSQHGCTIFVRLRQFRDDDSLEWVCRPGQTQPVLFENAHERVQMQGWAADAPISIDNPRGLELLVLSGMLVTPDGGVLDALTWARWPAGQPLRARAGPEGARAWWKEGAPVLAAD